MTPVFAPEDDLGEYLAQHPLIEVLETPDADLRIRFAGREVVVAARPVQPGSVRYLTDKVVAEVQADGPFDLLAVDLFPMTGRCEFAFARHRDLSGSAWVLSYPTTDPFSMDVIALLGME